MKFFEDSTFHGKLGKNFSKSLPQNLFKTRLDTFGNDFGRFRKFETFLSFLKIFEDSTFHGKLGKNFSKKLSKLQSKHVWILLGTILGVFGILKFFSIFLKIFYDSKQRGKLGKKFSKSLPQNTFKTRLDNFGNDFGHFWNFEKKNFGKFSKTRPSMEHWA